MEIRYGPSVFPSTEWDTFNSSKISVLILPSPDGEASRCIGFGLIDVVGADEVVVKRKDVRFQSMTRRADGNGNVIGSRGRSKMSFGGW